jgi:hypothetical protein
MAQSGDVFEQNADDTSNLLIQMLRTAETVLVKKLSNNDRDWAQLSNKHQYGVYIPVEQRDGGFFPTLGLMEREEGEPEIKQALFISEWPQLNERRETRLVNYRSKGEETHMTRIPKTAFSELSPASFIVIEKKREGSDWLFRCLTIDSASDAAVMLVDALRLPPDFHIEELQPARKIEQERGVVLSFAEEVIAAWASGNIASFAIDRTAMPETLMLARMAREAYLKKYSLKNLNPFEMAAPGDALREISRSIEWDLFREFQLKERAVGLVRIIMGDAQVAVDASAVIRRLVDHLPEVDRLMLSASQQRKSRAGQSFEHHIDSMLSDGAVPFLKQVVIQARKRPDFVLPSLSYLRKAPPGKSKGLILSAKTTLRERWKQVEREMHGAELFLATVDENIAANAIEEMNSIGIRLVVPEKLKKSDETEYDRHNNVLSFAEFFKGELRSRIVSWPLKRPKKNS